MKPGQVLLTEAEIAARVNALGRSISKTYRRERPLFLGVMNGALFFLADLLRAVEVEAEIATVRLASYRGTESTGRVRGLASLRTEVKGRRVVIVDDILDTGRTLTALKERLKELGATDVKICVLLAKRRKRELAIKADWVGFRIPDRFVVGYGLDYEGRYRGLKAIWTD